MPCNAAPKDLQSNGTISTVLSKKSPFATDVTDSVTTDTNRLTPPHGFRPGQLIVIGTGITGIAQMTLEAVSHIRTADVVFHTCSDSLSAEFIRRESKQSYDLYMLYDNGKSRHLTYVQMAEVMLREVRKGRFVVGVFYGHPGVFVSPSHRAIAIARQEGYYAKMLAAVSAEDCLFADIGFDPALPGCQTLEATDLLLRGRQLLPDHHLIIWQVGVVGKAGFQFGGYDNSKFQLLIDRLENEYGPDHQLVSYLAPTYNVAEPVVKRYTIKDMRKLDVVEQVSAASTFYIPPKIVAENDPDIQKKLGFKSVVRHTHGPFLGGEAYGDRERRAIEMLETHCIPEDYKRVGSSSAMYDVVYKLSTDPLELQSYRRSPFKYAQKFSELTPTEKEALASSECAKITAVMKKSSESVAVDFVEHIIRDIQFASSYFQILKQSRDKVNGEQIILNWLSRNGYLTTPEEVAAALRSLCKKDLNIYQSEYQTSLNGKPGPVIRIFSRTVSVNGIQIQKQKFDNGVLTWSASDGNPCSAALAISLLTELDGKSLPSDGYIGPRIEGTFWTSDVAESESKKLIGKVGVYSTLGIEGAVSSDPSSMWEGSYVVHIEDPDGNLKKGQTLEVKSSGAGIEVTYGGEVIKRVTFAANRLSWLSTDGNSTSASLWFCRRFVRVDSDTIPSKICFGKLWKNGDVTPETRNVVGIKGTREHLASASSYASNCAQWITICTKLISAVSICALGEAVASSFMSLSNYLSNRSDGNMERVTATGKSLQKKVDACNSLFARTVEMTVPGTTLIATPPIPEGKSLADVVSDVEVGLIIKTKRSS